MPYFHIKNSLGSIRAALKARPDGAITGAQLHALIQSVAPELNIREIVGIPTGPGALTKFIQEYLSDVVERIGTHGGDPLYGIIGHHHPAGGSREVSSIWRTFVSPASYQKIAYDYEDKTLKLLEGDLIAQGNFLEIPKASVGEHDRLRLEFIENLDPGEALEVKAVIEPDSEFQEWIGALRTEFPSLYRAWGNFRKRKLLDLFLGRADIAELDDTERQNLVEQIKASHFAAYESPKEQKLPAAPSLSLKRTSQTKSYQTFGELGQARALAHRAVDLMAHDDLRAIKLPLGLVLDAMQKPN